jgi:hypothetical protein
VDPRAFIVEGVTALAGPLGTAAQEGGVVLVVLPTCRASTAMHALGRLAAPESIAAAIAGVFDPGQARSRARCGLGSVRTRSAT